MNSLRRSKIYQTFLLKYFACIQMEDWHICLESAKRTLEYRKCTRNFLRNDITSRWIWTPFSSQSGFSTSSKPWNRSRTHRLHCILVSQHSNTVDRPFYFSVFWWQRTPVGWGRLLQTGFPQALTSHGPVEPWHDKVIDSVHKAFNEEW